MRFARVPPVSKPVARAKRKGDEFYQTKIPIKKVPVNFPKSYIFGITKVSGFEWYASLVLSPPTPSKLYGAGDCLQLVCDLLQNRPEVFNMEN